MPFDLSEKSDLIFGFCKPSITFHLSIAWLDSQAIENALKYI